ncbi:MAG: hypothetical protein H6767_01430 [Candidatus Peribacteria bacterium]|nr:MAG: hypothetical protein H6767_01430 [Candidatus Peribacteria bacterium]
MSYIDTHGSFDDLQDVYTLLNTIKTWILGDKSLTLAQILAKIELYTTYNYPINRQIVAEENKGVQIMTAHGSKGLEYEAVFVPGLYVGNWDDKRVVERVRLPLHLAGK